MREIKEFSPFVCEKLGYYVYFLIDPESDQIFYVGKGTGNRIFAHINIAISSPQESDKLKKIRSIHSKGLQVKHLIHRHGLTEKEAFEVEASLIDFIGLPGLTNIAYGQHFYDRGSMNVEDVIIQYDAHKIDIVEPVILFTVNPLFRHGMNEDELYEITRGNWVVGARRNNAKYAFCVYRGNVRQVYEIQRWFPVNARGEEYKKQDRWRFDGVIAQDLQHYVYGSVEHYIGSQNPIKYVNC